jgi:flagellum-specific peptidoglycan hydrolase FlgJ
MQPNKFIELIRPCAQASARLTGVPASFTMAQAALESGWGASGLAVQGKNLFGIKADPSWHGDTITMQTRECINGKWIVINAAFRKYADWQGSMDDHAAFLRRNKRYEPCFKCSTGADFARAVAKAGYATAPNYADTLVKLIDQFQLAKLDGVIT